MTNTKADLSKIIANNENITCQSANKMIDSVFSAIVQCLQSGESVKITGFGTFIVRRTDERYAMNPQTGKKILIPPVNRLAMKYSVPLAQAIRNDEEITKRLEAGD